MRNTYLNIFILCIIFQSCGAQKTIAPKYPVVQSKANTEDYFGNIVKDSLLILGEMDNPEILHWYKEQDSIASDWFESSEVLKAKYASYKEFSNSLKVFKWGHKMAANGTLLFYSREPDEKGGKLFLRKNENSEPQLVYDPKDYKEGKHNIQYFKLSYTGKYLAMAMEDGSPTNEIVVLDVEKQELLPIEPILYALPYLAGGIEWLPNETGFVYVEFPNASDPSKTLKHNSHSKLYSLKTNTSTPLFGKSNGISLSEKHYPIVSIYSDDDQYIFGHVAHVGRYWATYFMEIDKLEQGTIKWQPLMQESDFVLKNYFRIRNDELIYVSEKGGITKILSQKIDSSEKKRTLWTFKKEEFLQDLEFTENRIYVTTLQGIDMKLHSLDYHGKSAEVLLPFAARQIDFLNQSPNKNNIKIELSGATKDRAIYSIKEEKLVKSSFKVSDDFPQFDNIDTKIVEVKGHDGEMIPMTIISSREQTGSTKLMLEAYGAYGTVIRPDFNWVRLKWIADGGKIAIAHVRGGGAKGLDWHTAGKKSSKPNSWKDLISCSKYLLENKVVSKGNLFLYSTSAGAITIGMALNERPDLYSGVALLSPSLNPVRLEKSKKTGSSFEEYGSMQIKDEAQAVIQMDPYLNLKKNIDYPPIFIVSGFKDDRIPMSDPGKYLATLQSLNPNQTFLLDIYYNRNHYVYSWGVMAKVMNFFDYWAN